MILELAAVILWTLPPLAPAFQQLPPQPDIRNGDDSERDPAKRRRFIHELGLQRVGGCFLHFEGMHELPDRIPEAKKKELLDRCAGAAPGLGRPQHDDIRWWARFRTDTDGTEHLDGISAEWSTIGRYSVFASCRIGSDHICIRVGVPSHQRVDVQAFGAERYTRPKEELNLGEAQRMLRFLLGRKPNSEDIITRGHLIVADGIQVLVARGAIRRDLEVDDQSGQPPVYPTDVLITDSDPQYISMSFDLRENP